eukprot:TRINITY_DN18498_c0_g1_i1.p1 TRINITY_DN18498_c0_g1~~TRINITY_DN18498_c0_g1_i1.p1  ORF type:complete len:189 (+),score=14.13 TRINITY_DN18498_c0_g1_i1:191-757(+)
MDHLPPNITPLTFVTRFNQSVNQLPGPHTSPSAGTSTSQWTSCRAASHASPSAQTSTNRWTSCHLASHTSPSAFNQSVDQLPPSITQLTFRFDFHLSVDLLTYNITHLTFSCNFNQSQLQPVSGLPAAASRTSHLAETSTSPWITCRLASRTALTFGLGFNMFVDQLPHSITLALRPVSGPTTDGGPR